MFDCSKIKRFDMSDLSGRTLEVETISDSGVQLTMGMDPASGEVFVLEAKNVPVDAILEEES